jgi:hypothetical protein
MLFAIPSEKSEKSEAGSYVDPARQALSSDNDVL